MNRAQAGRFLFVAALIVSGCGSSTNPPGTGSAGKDGGAAGTGGAGTTGAAGTGGAGTTGAAGSGGAGTTGAAGMDGGAGTTGAAGMDAAAGTGSAGTGADGAAGMDGGGSDLPAGNDGSTDVASDAPTSACTSPASTNLVNTAGTAQLNQGFQEMRVLEITPSLDVVVTSLVLDGYVAGVAGTLGARIYDAASHALVASASKAVAMGTGLTVEVPISATLTAGKAYRVGFLGGMSANGDLFQPDSTSYTVGPFKISGVFQSNDDSFPANVNIFAPRVTIKGCAAASDGGTTSDATSDSAAACNALDVQGAAITKTTNAGAPPAMTGGTIVAGTYLLTAMDKYNGTQGSNTHRETWVFTAGHVELAIQDSEKGNVVQRYSASYATTGTNGIVLTFTCPAAVAGMAKTSQFTATATAIKYMGEPNSTDQEIHTLTLQP
jgi:hypothetical protein